MGAMEAIAPTLESLWGRHCYFRGKGEAKERVGIVDRPTVIYERRHL